MAEQYSGSMMVDLDNTVAKTLKPYDFPQHGVFTLDIVPYFNISVGCPSSLWQKPPRPESMGPKRPASPY
jgi:hypothetical protein